MTAMELDMYNMVVQENGEVTYQLTDPTKWGAWAHEGHRLWASMSEDFWLYEYKVRMCPQPYSHDWTACPYAHKDERARRRDPRRFNYIAVSCPEYRANARAHAQLRFAGTGHPPPTCVRGLRCRYAHGVFELWLHPSRFRTRTCDAGARCQRQICFFAHFMRELRGEGPIAAFAAAAATVQPSTFAMPRTPPHILQRAPFTSVTRPHALPAPQLFDDVTLQAIPNRLRMLSLYSAITGDDVFSSPIATAAAVVTAATTMPTLRVPLLACEEEEDAKSIHCADDEDSLLNDYPHRDLIMDFMR